MIGENTPLIGGYTRILHPHSLLRSTPASSNLAENEDFAHET
jgi:hypothetical protein